MQWSGAMRGSLVLNKQNKVEGGGEFQTTTGRSYAAKHSYMVLLHGGKVTVKPMSEHVHSPVHKTSAANSRVADRGATGRSASSTRLHLHPTYPASLLCFTTC